MEEKVKKKTEKNFNKQTDEDTREKIEENLITANEKLEYLKKQMKNLPIAEDFKYR